jgi:hypothetical protein
MAGFQIGRPFELFGKIDNHPRAASGCRKLFSCSNALSASIPSVASHVSNPPASRFTRNSFRLVSMSSTISAFILGQFSPISLIRLHPRLLRQLARVDGLRNVSVTACPHGLLPPIAFRVRRDHDDRNMLRFRVTFVHGFGDSLNGPHKVGEEFEIRGIIVHHQDAFVTHGFSPPRRRWA